MKFSNTHIKLIITALATLAMVIVYTALFLSIKNKNNQISILENQVDIEVRKDQRLHSIKQVISDVGEEIKRVDTYLISEDGVVELLEDLESLGRTVGVTVGVNSVSVDKADAGLPYELLRIDFVARGGWRNIIQLVSLLETFPRGLTIERMHIERSATSGLWQVNASFGVLKLK
ncbi:MAG: type 4a pilus biogenesis protein PilO [Candidatus Paceibacterota bacterium]